MHDPTAESRTDDGRDRRTQEAVHTETPAMGIEGGRVAVVVVDDWET
jgi:hypothetical protein